MKLILKSITCSVLFVCLMVLNLSAQAHMTIEHNSVVGTNSPHLLLLENEPPGTGDGWSRLWFKNAADTANRWAFLARPAAGEQDNQGILDQPIIMAFNGVQKFGVDSDGVVRINKVYTLPNDTGQVGQVMQTDGISKASWAYLDRLQDDDGDTKIGLHEAAADHISFTVDGDQIMEVKNNSVIIQERTVSQKASSFTDPNIQIHNPNDDYSYVTFSNGGFANNRFAIAADPSSSGGSGDAKMNFYWGSTSNAALQTNFISLNASDAQIDLIQNTKVEGNLEVLTYLKMNPRSLAPTCAAGGADNGKIYFNSVAKKVRVCVDGAWQNLN